MRSRPVVVDGRVQGGYILSRAEISADGVYRYSLERAWAAGPTRLIVIGLNPSTADADVDDPTIRRCVGFARRLGLAGLVMGNLFAFRSSRPVALRSALDPIGPENDRALLRMCGLDRSGFVVAAWGAGAAAIGHGKRADDVYRELWPRHLYSFGETKGSFPRHPLYLPAGTPLSRWPS